MQWPVPAESWSTQTHALWRAFYARCCAMVTPWALAASIILLGGLLRLYHFDTLSLWVDEGLTAGFARLPWSTLLGFGQVYSPHPPLYFALVKLLSYLCPALIAGRLISVVAGALTIAVLYALAARLLQPRAGVGAALALSLCPLHIWYSQEARPYALVVLLVALSYLALAGIYQGGRRWLVVYGLALTCALYTDVSAFFALVPQVALHAYMIMIDRQGARVRDAALTLAAVAAAFLPWLPRLLTVAGPTSAQPQYALSADKVAGSLLSVTGLAANQAVFAGAMLPPWSLWPAAHWPLALSLVLAAAVGTLALARLALARLAPIALLATWSIGAGTILVAVAVSLVYPSYVERTILAAVLGWALLVGAAPFVTELPRVLAIVARLNVVVTLALSAVTLNALYSDAYKQEWRALAQQTAVAASFGWPVATYPTVAGTLIGLYQPGALAQRHIALDDGQGLPAAALAQARRDGAVWLAYLSGTGEQRLQDQLAAHGFARLLHLYYPYPLYLDLYVRPGAALGAALPINGRFAGRAGQAPGWQLPARGSRLVAEGAAGSRLVLTNTAPSESAARTAIAARPNHLYTLDAQVRSALRAGSSRAFLICVSASGTMLSIAPDGAGASVANDGHWHAIQIGALCPDGTDHVRVDLRNSGLGAVGFRDVRLRALGPA